MNVEMILYREEGKFLIFTNVKMIDHSSYLGIILIEMIEYTWGN